jgi:hypothetical protein
MMPPRLFGLIFVTTAVLFGGVYGSYSYLNSEEQIATIAYATPEEQDPYVRFQMEAYDSILKNYWKKASEADLAGLFQLSLQKVSGSSTPLVSNDRSGTAKMLASYLQTVPDDKKKQHTIDTLIVALYNLPPEGRDQLLSFKQEKELREEVSNINPEKDLYADVGAQKGASITEVKAAYEEKKEVLEKENTAEAKQQLAQATYAYDVLAKEETKGRYDTAKIEPTIFSRRIGQTLYVYISKMAPTTLDEFVSIINENNSAKLDSLIIDLRGNIGGSLDIAPSFIGLFMGQNSYTFDLFHQDVYEPIRSPAPKLEALAKFKDVAVLTDSMSQSTAEVIAAALKRFNIAHVIGTPTRGWGTVENTFPLATEIDPNEKYTLLLVHSLTLREDNQPIESRGVDPDIDIKDVNWKVQLSSYFRSASLIEAVRTVGSKPPVKD